MKLKEIINGIDRISDEVKVYIITCTICRLIHKSKILNDNFNRLNIIVYIRFTLNK